MSLSTTTTISEGKLPSKRYARTMRHGSISLQNAVVGLDKGTEQETHTMIDELRVRLSQLLRKAKMEQDADFLKEGGVRALSQARWGWRRGAHRRRTPRAG